LPGGFEIAMNDRYVDIFGMFYFFAGEKGKKRFNICPICLDCVVGEAFFCDEIPVESFMQTMKVFR
jgi:hypothetical protein